MSPDDLRQHCDHADRQGLDDLVLTVRRRPSHQRSKRCVVAPGVTGRILASMDDRTVVQVPVKAMRALLDRLPPADAPAP